MTDRGENDEYLTKREFAEELRVDPRTVERWIKNGRIAAEKVGDAGLIRIRRSQLAAVTSPAASVDSSPTQESTDALAVAGARS